MKDTTIKKEQGYLGPYPCKLKPGDVQSMIFNEADNGPFWMTREEQENKRHDKTIQDQSTSRMLRKGELKVILAEKNLSTKGTSKELLKRAQEHNIKTKVT
jgi:hypothetical protein